MAGYPVYTNRWLPATSVGSQNATAFMIFGNMKACAFGDKGDMRVAQFTSGSFGGKEVALANQTGIVYRHRHAFVVVLPKAFTVISTHS
jgi:HK97 family phage major capsid protein